VIASSLLGEISSEEVKTPDANTGINRQIRKISSFATMVGKEIGQEETNSALGRVYNSIFNSAKEISMHLRYSTGNLLNFNFNPFIINSESFGN
jgi:hypothetical protein